MKWYIPVLGLSLSFCHLNAQPASDTTLRRVGVYFAELSRASARPEARLWGRNLVGPLIMVDPTTREVFANQADKEGLLKLVEQVYYGKMLPNANIANTCLAWGGISWAMVLLPLSDTPVNRIQLLMHESFHRLQDSLGLPTNSPNCDHLDTEAGRVWLRLELAALVRAWQQPAGERKQDLESAMIFREYRYALCPGAREKEEELEWNEGLAEFTGVYASRIWMIDTGFMSRIPLRAIKVPSLTRSFAYLTGPLYGMLLSQRREDWQRHITASDNFEALTAQAYGLDNRWDSAHATAASLQAAAMQRREAYNGTAIMQEEDAREQVRLGKEKKYIDRFVKGPVLLFSCKHMRVNFNPNDLFSLGENGIVYPEMSMTDDWGRIVVTGGALFKDWKYLYVPVDDSLRSSVNLPGNAPSGGASFKGPGWQLELKKGWRLLPGSADSLSPGSRAADFSVVKDRP